MPRFKTGDGLTRVIDVADVAHALQQVARILSKSPRADEYKAIRSQLKQDGDETGNPCLLPSYSTIHRLFPSWDDALTAADLKPLGCGRTGAREPTRRSPTHDESACIFAINQARAALGDPLSAKAYYWWRREQIGRDPRAAYSLPAYVAIWRRFGNWNVAMKAATAAAEKQAAA